MIKYKLSIHFQAKIEPVEVERETLNSVWVDGRRSPRVSTFQQFFDTFEEAKAFAVGRLAEKVETYKRQTSDANDELNRARALTCPEV